VNGHKRPSWDAPFPYGYAASIDGMGTISAPLLAATSTALLGLVLTLGDSIRWANLALLLLVSASFAFVSAVQLTFWAKRFVVTPSEIEDWWPDHDEPERHSELEWEQRFHQRRFAVWANRSRVAYNAGVLCLLASLPVMLVPKRVRLHQVNDLRLAAVCIALLAFSIETVWIGFASLRPTILDPRQDV
jgi:hypothetical protein